MPYSPQPSSDIILPGLAPESTLRDLPLYAHQLESHCPGKDAAHVFEDNPFLPGVILTEQNELLGAISRRRFLEEMSRPYGLDLFLNRPLKVLHSFVAAEIFIFPGDTLVVVAARESLKRSPENLYEPVVVQLEPQVYRLLDVYQLLVAQSQIHELTRQLLSEQTQAQMIQAEKMATLGRMVAGVAHDILNPVNFITGNIGYLASYSRDLIDLLSIYDAEIPSLPEPILTAKDEVGLDFLLQDLPRILDSMKMGAERLKNIAVSLRNFSHMNESDRKPTDIHICIDNTLLILNNRLKNAIHVVREYGDLPPVDCYLGQLSQVFMNIIGNAIDALLDKASQQSIASQEQELASDTKTGWQPQITITTAIYPSENPNLPHWVAIRIADNGPGIPADIQGRIFETFFTTKPVGEGTGLGLAISHQIVTEKHGGKINLRSQVGVGTEFEILLPLIGRSLHQELNPQRNQTKGSNTEDGSRQGADTHY